MSTPQNGIVAVRVNGNPLRLKGTVTHSLGGKTREVIEGPAGVVGFAVTFKAPFIEVASIDAEDVDLAELQKLKDQTITGSLENGKTIVLNEASTVGLIEVTSDAGEFTIRFAGTSAREI